MGVVSFLLRPLYARYPFAQKVGWAPEPQTEYRTVRLNSPDISSSVRQIISIIITANGMTTWKWLTDQAID